MRFLKNLFCLVFGLSLISILAADDVTPSRAEANELRPAGAEASFTLPPLPDPSPAAEVVYDVMLRGGRIIDGTGNPWFEADLAILGDRIAAIGPLPNAKARRSIDVRGLIVSPGFIDMLGQSEYTVLVDPHVRSKISQGITTELTGEGGSVAPQTSFTGGELRQVMADLPIRIDWSDFEGYFRKVREKGTAVNFAHLVGSGQVRQAVLRNENRAPTPTELEAMKRHVAMAMEQGTFGLSSALIYPPNSFAGTSELVELAKVAARYGGIYATHVRNESIRLVPAIEEAAAVGERAKIPVEIWHFKSSGRANWGRIIEGVRAIEAARQRGVDMTADLYPYIASSTDLNACLPPWSQEGGLEALVARLRDPAERRRIRLAILTPAEDWENLWDETEPERVLIVGVKKTANKKYQGMRLNQIAAARGIDPIDAMFDLLIDEGGTAQAVYFDMAEEDVRKAMVQPWAAFDCDASGVRPEGILGSAMTHPRAYGSFPRILGTYTRELKILRLEDTIRKMTSLPAQRLGLRDRGLLRPGFYADVTVFDPDKVIDRATFEAPHQYSEGIVHVFVNGQAVIEAGRVTDSLPGRILRGPGYRPAR